jgi:FtsH-binding integral membrane protein
MNPSLVGGILFVSGLLIFCFGGLGFLVAAFRESIWWGLACLLIPIVQLFFLIVHWQSAKRPFAYQVFGFALMIIAFIISPQTLHH